MFELIKKDSGEGIVCAVSKGGVFVAPLDADPSQPEKKSCGAIGSKGCAGCGGCSGLISAPDGGYVGRFFIRVDDPRNFKQGDRVRYRRFIPEPNLMSILLFGIPIIFAAGAMAGWYVIAPQSAESPIAIASVIAAFFGGFIVPGIIDKVFKAKYPAAIIDQNSMDGGDVEARALHATPLRCGNINGSGGIL